MTRPRGRSRKTCHTAPQGNWVHPTFPWLEGGLEAQSRITNHESLLALGWLEGRNPLPTIWLVGGLQVATYTIRTISVHDPYTIRTPSVRYPYTIYTGYGVAINGLHSRTLRAYSQGARFTPGDLISRLRTFAAQTNHEFWPDDVSLRDGNLFKAERIHSSRQLTDLWLLALASKHGGRLATFDQGMAISAVSAANAESLCVI